MATRTVVIEPLELHAGQQKIIQERKRFNVVSCGRRFGKTALGERLLTIEDDRSNGAVFGHPVAYFTPTFRMLEEVYRNITIDFAPIITRKHQNNKIMFDGGGYIDFWSLDNFDSVRGRAYKRIILDEVAILGSANLKEAWEQSIRALLTDYEGDAYFLSTPKGIKHYFHDLSKNAERFDNWAFFKMPTSINPNINPEEIAEAQSMLTPIVFAQEYLAEFTDMRSDNLFIFSFSKEKHVPLEPIQYDPKYPLIISVDFNVNPMTAIVCQHDTHYRFINVIDEFRTLNSDVYQLCDQIKQRYDTTRIFVTGDAAGWNRSASTRGQKSMFDIMQLELRLNWSQIKTPKGKGAGYVGSKRGLANALFSRHPNFKISTACPFLIEDIQNVQVTSEGMMEKTKDATRSHLLDCLCDYLITMCKDAIKFNHGLDIKK